jgi:CRISPR-associated endonuclease/helicase Cas3
MEKAQFIQQAKQAGLLTTRFEKVLCYLKLTGYREIREDWHFIIPAISIQLLRDCL